MANIETDNLQREIINLTNDGYYILNQNESSAQLKKDKNFSWIFACLWALVGGGGIIVYLVYYWIIKKDDYQYVIIKEKTNSVVEGI